MKKNLVAMMAIVAVLFVVPILAFAEVSVDVSGLTEKQKAELAIKAEEMKTQAKGATTAEKVNEWVEVGKNMGQAIASTAKEIGIAADRFLETKTGKITMLLIVWKIAGRDLLGAAVGVSFLLISIVLWVYFFRKMCVIKSIAAEYPESGFFRFLPKRRTVTNYDGDDVEGTRIIMAIVLVVLVVISMIIIF